MQLFNYRVLIKFGHCCYTAISCATCVPLQYRI